MSLALFAPFTRYLILWPAILTGTPPGGQPSSPFVWHHDVTPPQPPRSTDILPTWCSFAPAASPPVPDAVVATAPAR